MKKMLITFLFIGLLVSCKGNSDTKTETINKTEINNSADYEGEWKNNENSNEIMTISKNGNNYIVAVRGRKLVATVENDIITISVQGKEIKGFIDSNEILTIEKYSYSRVE